MRKGSLPYSVARSLPASAIEPSHTPDGLDESAIDALIDEAYSDVPAARSRPVWLSADATEQRRVRRRVRRVVRFLPGVLASSDSSPGPTEGQAA